MLLYGKIKDAINEVTRKGGKCLAFLLFLFSLTLGAKANPVDDARARRVATTFLNNNGVRSVELTDMSSVAGFSNVYVFTTETSFVLLAADDRVQPILGYSLTGGFDVENMPGNKRAWIQGYSDEIQYAVDNQLRASSEVMQQWQDLAEGNRNTGRAITAVAPLLQTQWDQGNPYNLLCPGGSVTGCVATAMAQVMKYWNYPEHGIGSHSYTHATYGELSADFQFTTYDWTNMTNTYSGSSTNAQKMAVATLMYHCGVSVDMNYSPSASGAGSAIVAEALKNYFNYSPETVFHNRSGYADNTWITMLKNDLNLSRPVWYCGTGSGGGHAFVFDGYNSSDYFHVNWGWGGYCDEYYTINNLNPGPGGIGSGSNGIYNDSQGAVFGIRPSECAANVPTNLTYSQNGRNVTLSWSAASGASSYKVYCNNSFIGNASSTSFTDTAPFGSSVYYVRSVDSQGRLSLSSNAVTVIVEYSAPVVDDLAATVSGNSVNLTWSAPNWCYPATPTATMTYGDGNFAGGFGSTNLYWGHRYPASSLSSYNNMKVYKVSFYARETGPYQVHVYKGTTSNHPQTQLLQQSFSVGSLGWSEVDLSTPIQIDASYDLWVFISDPENRDYPATFCNYSGSDGNYYSSNPTSWVGTYGNAAFLIRTFISDGTYTYNIYRNGTSIANNLSSTTYSDNNLAAGIYNYYVKTNYYAGETDASNQVSVQIGTGTLYTISASANPTEGGTVTGMGSFFANQTCTLNATPNEGYEFVNWTKNDAIVSTNASYSFSVTGNAAYVANFISTTPPSSLQVFAEYYPNASNPSSPYVKVSWNNDRNEQSCMDGDDVEYGSTMPDRYTFSIYRSSCDGGEEELIAENVTGNHYIDNGWTALVPGSYKYGVSVANGRGKVSEIHWNDAPVAENHRTIDASTLVSFTDRRGELGDPLMVNYDDGWLYYDDGTYAMSVGAGGSLYWGMMIPSASLTPYSGNALTKVALYSVSSGTATLSIYLGGNTAPAGLPVVTQSFTMLDSYGFMEIDLNDMVAIDGTQNLWVVFYNQGVDFPASACNDTGEANNRWVSFDGGAWYDFANLGLSGYGWMIRAYVEATSPEIFWSNCIEKQSTVQQSISLGEGTNWFSTYVDITLNDLKAALVAAMPNNNATITIKSKTQNVKYQNGRWAGQLTVLDVAQMYKITVPEACEISLEGVPVDPSTLTLTITPGANWIAFPYSESMSVTNFFGSFPVNNDVVKSKLQNTRYSNGRWAGQLNTLIPGQGYIYNSVATGNRTFTFPTSAK